MVTLRNEFSFLMLKTIFYSLTMLVCKISSLPLENKIHIFAPSCNILYILHSYIDNYVLHVSTVYQITFKIRGPTENFEGSIGVVLY